MSCGATSQSSRYHFKDSNDECRELELHVVYVEGALGTPVETIVRKLNLQLFWSLLYTFKFVVLFMLWRLQ